MADDLDELELSLRRIPGVCGFGLRRTPLGTEIEVILSQLDIAAEIGTRAARLADLHLTHPVRVVVRPDPRSATGDDLTSRGPLEPLPVDEQLMLVPGVRRCVAERGVDDRLIGLTISVGAGVVIDDLRRELSTLLGTSIPPSRVVLERVLGDEAAGPPGEEPGPEPVSTGLSTR